MARFPVDLDWWVAVIGALTIAVAAIQTLLSMVAADLQGWGGSGLAQLPAPSITQIVLLLGGLIVLVARRAAWPSARGRGWLEGLCCLAAGTAATLVIFQTAGAVQLFQSASTYPVRSAQLADIGDFGLPLLAVAAVVLAVLLYRWSRQPVAVANDGGAFEAAGAERGAVGRVSVRRPVGAVLLGLAVAVAGLVAFNVGLQRQGANLIPSEPSEAPSSSGFGPTNIVVEPYLPATVGIPETPGVVEPTFALYGPSASAISGTPGGEATYTLPGGTWVCTIEPGGFQICSAEESQSAGSHETGTAIAGTSGAEVTYLPDGSVCIVEPDGPAFCH